ncbi:MAG: metal ABC transporter permease [Corynebacterium casei]|uniref:metal ABC transporter permease n=1 Tax=Corynebacterium casei TaxID=160386 RepID=UPI002648B2BE|nr:metal ABC transporter permease [Corynebacterium casei]MDN5901755.1 metal ABC transporter permease [Corynebacterium casei]MDN6443815.1 metal ABC transporter permease [Corynebacterium casei]MDN6627731.1 metal ABC transporter permease [Corynebacterium casei]MDN6672848.1 metal ABC transporter permease [Corynebacterium casei]MDN6693385.1 metal ABC transporter permease [Corynebacterium casei]
MDFETMWEDTVYLLSVDFVQQALIACALLGVLSGVMTSLIVLRQMSFSVHATSELALMGAAAALLFGLNIGWGAIAGAIGAAIVLAVLGFKGQQDSAIGVVMSFGLGLSVLFIHLYPGNSTAAMSLLTGQIVGVSSASVWLLALTTVIVVGAVVLFWRPMLFASADPIMAQAAGIPVRAIAVLFAVLVGLAAAQSVQIVGALLVMALLITPGAAAVQITSSPLKSVMWSVIFAEIAAVGGLVLSLAPGLPVSVFVTTISFIIYLICRGIGKLMNRRAVRDDIAAKRDSQKFTAAISPQHNNADPAEVHHTSHHDERCDHVDD